MHALPLWPQRLELKRAPRNEAVRLFLDELYRCARSKASAEEVKRYADGLKNEGFRIFLYAQFGCLNARTNKEGELYCNPPDNTPNDDDSVKLLKLVLQCFYPWPSVVRNEDDLWAAKRDGRAKKFIWDMIAHIQRRK